MPSSRCGIGIDCWRLGGRKSKIKPWKGGRPQEQRQKSEEREKAIKELITFVTKKRGELGDMIAAPTPEDLDTVSGA
ncbi:unnamed protein product, partial [Mesorhabditis spiculigera]